MSLGDQQRTFTLNIAILIYYAYDMGYELSFGDAYRDHRLHGDVGEKKGYGHKSSAHKVRLAVDFNLFSKGAYLSDTEHHKVLGEYWRTLNPLNRWGGDFKNPDGNHYSMLYNGVM